MRTQDTVAKKPVIVVIGGTFGSGKTVLAHRLCSRLRIFRHIELGPIIETLKLHPRWRNLACRIYFWNIPRERYLSMPEVRVIARPINHVVHALVQHCRMFGTDAVVEGVELFPSMLGLNDVTLWTYLAPPAAGVHRKRLTRAQTHFKREITKNEFEYVRAIDRMLRMECRRFKIPVLSSAPLRVLENQVARLLNESKLRPDSNNADRS